MRQLLSVRKYENFKKRLNEVYSSLDNFYNQFGEILRVRIKKQDISLVKNPKLAMYNLYSASKALVEFQKEFNLLFSDYSSFDENFYRQELENMLTLVNVCRYVIDNPPKGNAIAYDSKLNIEKELTILMIHFQKLLQSLMVRFLRERNMLIFVLITIWKITALK